MGFGMPDQALPEPESRRVGLALDSIAYEAREDIVERSPPPIEVCVALKVGDLTDESGGLQPGRGSTE